MLSRRSFFTGLGLMVAAPAIVRAESLMPIRAPRLSVPPSGLGIFSPPRLFRITRIYSDFAYRVSAEAHDGVGVRMIFDVPSNSFGLNIGDLVEFG